ncbi:MAG: ankyrin repeat domain-containing protein [Nitrospira sp.]|nr:ankyrin repeat domain-containing protein [Nitrospira sp.]MCP9462083.1 ankyrin repeat domain-containing protein [Nitrospira sp.]MCP9475170.1 ankyrin repeat domain-containing protein [Nitrospira sp.]
MKNIVERYAMPHRKTAIHALSFLSLLFLSGCIASPEHRLREAIINGDSTQAAAALAHGAKVETTDEFGMTPLLLAVKHGHQPTVELLLEKGADLSRARHDGLTPLFMAIREGRADMVALLLEKGADVNVRGAISSVTPLHVGAYEGNQEIVMLLLKYGADKQARMTSGELPVDLARQLGRTNLIKLLEP